jgi:hypothetical protein
VRPLRLGSEHVNQANKSSNQQTSAGWNTLPNNKIASAYIQAHRIAAKVVHAQGDNAFLGSGGDIHTGINRDFEAALTGGLVRKDKQRIAGPVE